MPAIVTATGEDDGGERREARVGDESVKIRREESGVAAEQKRGGGLSILFSFL